MKFIFVLLVSSIFFLSCSGDDNASINQELTNTWILQRIVCFCGFPENYDFTQTTFTIDTEAETVSIINSGSVVALAETGTYSLKSEGTNGLLFNNDSKYSYEIEGGQLILMFVDNPQIADDEITYILKSK